MFFGLADLITDAVTYTRLRDGAIPVSNEGAKAAYVAILCFGAATTAVALAYRLHNVRLVRAHLHEFGRQGRKVTGSEARQQAQQHDWEMAQTHRTKVVLSLELLSVAAQGAGCTASCVGWMDVRSSRCSSTWGMDATALQVCLCPASTFISSSSTTFKTKWCGCSSLK